MQVFCSRRRRPIGLRSFLAFDGIVVFAFFGSIQSEKHPQPVLSPSRRPHKSSSMRSGDLAGNDDGISLFLGFLQSSIGRDQLSADHAALSPDRTALPEEHQGGACLARQRGLLQTASWRWSGRRSLPGREARRLRQWNVRCRLRSGAGQAGILGTFSRLPVWPRPPV